MEKTLDIQYFTEKCIRRGVATYTEIKEFGEGYGTERGDLLVDALNTAGVRLIDENDIVCSPQTNVLMNDLRLVELVSLALQLPVAPKIRRKLYKDVVQQRTFELDLRRLDYLDSDEEWYYCSPGFNRLQQALRHLLDSGQVPFGKEWKNEKMRESHEYLRGLMAHPLFVERILPLIREHYLGLREVRLFIGWIKATGNDAPVMVDIVQAALRQDGPDLVRGVLFSNQASTADSALRNRQDVCFFCPSERRCLPIQNVDDPYDILAEYRYTDMNTLVAKRYPMLSFERYIANDMLIVKFFVPYSIVVTGKKFMTDIHCLRESTTLLYKNTGKYCPYHDKWPIDPGLE